MKTITKTIGLLFFTFFICSCASLGTKTIYSAGDLGSGEKISEVYVIMPTLVNVDFYKNSTADFYFDEIERVLKEYNIEIVKADTSISNFDNITSDTKVNIPSASGCNFILLGKITRLSAMGITRDFKVDYKLVNPLDGKLKYHSCYSTTLGKTYTIIPGSGLPSEEQLMRDAIRLGFQNIKRDIFSK